MHKEQSILMIRCVLLLLITLLLASCINPPMYVETKGRIRGTSDKIDEINKDAYKIAPSVVTKKGSYVDTKPISLDQPPDWLTRPMTVHGTSLPLSFFVNRILSHTGAFVHFDGTVDKNKVVSMNYQGTIEGALNNLKIATDYNYTIHDNTVAWSAFETKTFNIAFLPGTSSFQMGGDGGGGGSSGGGGSTEQVVATALDTGGQYSRLQSSSDLWADLQGALQTMISPEGKVVVSQATTTVMVRDHPENIAAVTKYIDKLNATLSKQVLLDVQVLDVTLNHGFYYGIDWNLVHDNLVLSGNLTPTAGVTPVGGTSGLILGLGKANQDNSDDDNNLNGDGTNSDGGNTQNNLAKAAINALKQQGNVAVLTQPRIVTLNNQVAAVNITTQQSYLASVESFTPQTGDSSTSEVTPGQTLAGLVLYILPKIEGDDVYLQVNMTLSGDPTFENVTSGGSLIQVPNQDFQSFNQRARVASNNTLVLSGFKKLSDTADQSSFMGIDALGGKGSNTINRELVVMITPIVLGMPG